MFAGAAIDRVNVRAGAVVARADPRRGIDLLAVLRADDVADRGSVGQRGELSDDEHERCTGSSERSWSTHSPDRAMDASKLHLHAAPA